MLLLLACTQPTEDPTPELQSLALPSYLLVPEGGEGELSVVATGTDGEPYPVKVSWTVEDEGVVSVQNGTASASGVIGSTVVTAEAEGVTSNPTLVYVARVAEGAVLVPDDAVGELALVEDDPETLEGLLFTASIDRTLNEGDLVIGSGVRFPPARVVASGDPATFALVAVDEAFEELSVSGEAADFVRADEELAVYLGIAVGKPLHFGGMDCRFSADSSTDLLTVTETELTLEHALKPTFDYQVTGFTLDHAELLVEGDLGIDARFTADVSDNVKGSMTCGALSPIYGTFPLPPFLGGPLIMGYVPFYAGIQLEVETKNYGPQIGFAFTGDIHATAGVAYANGAFENLNSFESDLELTPIFEVPTDDDRVIASAWPFASIGLGPGIPTVPKPKFFAIVEANAGPKLKADLAAPEAQIEDKDYASTLGVDLAWTVGPPQNVTDVVSGFLGARFWLLGRLAGNLTGALTYSDSTELWTSTGGALSVDSLDETAVAGTVALDSEPGWAVDALLVQSWDGESLTTLDTVPLGESDLDIAWSADLDNGAPDVFAAFLETTLLDLPLEVDVVDLRCSTLNFVVDDLVLPTDAEDDGVDADQALLAHYELVVLLYDYYAAQRDYWLSQYQYYTATGQHSAAASAWSLWELYSVYATNLSTEAVGDASFYVAVAGMDEGLMRFDGGAEEDDVEGAIADFAIGSWEAGSATGSPAWDAFSENSAEHRLLFAAEHDGNYPLLVLWDWKAARRPDDSVFLQLQGFTGVAAYATDPSYTMTLDGTDLWGGGAFETDLDTAHTLELAFSASGYDQAAYPSMDETGTVSGTFMRIEFHVEEGGGCP